MSAKKRTFCTGLGKLIAEALNDAGLTGQQLADALGISQQQLTYYEVGCCRLPV